MNWIIIGLNWTDSLKYLEMTFAGIWRYTNKTELNWIDVYCVSFICYCVGISADELHTCWVIFWSLQLFLNNVALDFIVLSASSADWRDVFFFQNAAGWNIAVPSLHLSMLSSCCCCVLRFKYAVGSLN